MYNLYMKNVAKCALLRRVQKVVALTSKFSTNVIRSIVNSRFESYVQLASITERSLNKMRHQQMTLKAPSLTERVASEPVLLIPDMSPQHIFSEKKTGSHRIDSVLRALESMRERVNPLSGLNTSGLCSLTMIDCRSYYMSLCCVNLVCCLLNGGLC